MKEQNQDITSYLILLWWFDLITTLVDFLLKIYFLKSQQVIIFFFFRNGLLSSKSFQSWSPCHSIRSFLTSVIHSCTTKQNGGRCLPPWFTSSGFKGLWVTSFGQEDYLGTSWQSQSLRNWGFFVCFFFFVKKFWRLNKLSLSYVSKQCSSKRVALSYI